MPSCRQADETTRPAAIPKSAAEVAVVVTHLAKLAFGVWPCGRLTAFHGHARRHGARNAEDGTRVGPSDRITVAGAGAG